MRVRTVRLLTLLSFVGLLAACEATKSANPLSPSVAGPIPGVVISEPKLLEPGAGWMVDDASQPVRLLIENSSTTGQRPLSYTFDIASDAQFNTMVFGRGGVPQGDGGRTSIQMTDRLPTGRAFFWRARAADGANTGPYSAALSFSIVTPVVIDRPTPIAPVGGVTVSSTRPTFRFNNSARSGPVGQISYTLEVAKDEAFASKVVGYTAPEQANETSVASTVDLPSNQTLFWRVRAFDTGPSGQIGAWAATQVFTTPSSSGGGGGGGGNEGGVAGCRNGRLEDPKAYFFALIGRAEGDPAPDWPAVLAASGIPNGNPPYVQSDPRVHYGITQQIGAGGPRGVLFLPTDVPDANGYYTRQILVITGDNRWTWIDRFADGPPYAPRPCP